MRTLQKKKEEKRSPPDSSPTMIRGTLLARTGPERYMIEGLARRPRPLQFKVLHIRHAIGPGNVAQAVARAIPRPIKCAMYISTDLPFSDLSCAKGSTTKNATKYTKICVGQR